MGWTPSLLQALFPSLARRWICFLLRGGFGFDRTLQDKDGSFLPYLLPWRRSNVYCPRPHLFRLDLICICLALDGCISGYSSTFGWKDLGRYSFTCSSLKIIVSFPATSFSPMPKLHRIVAHSHKSSFPPEIAQNRTCPALHPLLPTCVLPDTLRH